MTVWHEKFPFGFARHSRGGSDCTHEIDGEGFQYVLDGGYLLQRIPWTHGDSFGSIAQMYVDHVIKK
jgi:hypothetical protein